MNRIRVRAWWIRPFYNDAMKVMAVRSMGVMKMHESYADFFLELVSETEDGGATYRVYGNMGQPIQFRALEVVGVPARDLPFGRIMMAGDTHTLWRVARSIEDSSVGNQLMWLLVADRRADTEPADVPPQTTCQHASP
jgi:hypothetical protein